MYKKCEAHNIVLRKISRSGYEPCPQCVEAARQAVYAERDRQAEQCWQRWQCWQKKVEQRRRRLFGSVPEQRDLEDLRFRLRSVRGEKAFNLLRSKPSDAGSPEEDYVQSRRALDSLF